MNRRLQNTFSALLASASALALCLAVALPAPQPAKAQPIALALGPVDFTFTPSDPTVPHAAHVETLSRDIERKADQIETLADATKLAAELATAAALASTLKDGTAYENATIENEKKQARTAARHRRQTLVMPYFSFAPRG